MWADVLRLAVAAGLLYGSWRLFECPLTDRRLDADDGRTRVAAD
jgi:hypothetical protein